MVNQKRKCIDCNKKLCKYSNSIRCYSCNNKYLWKSGKKVGYSKFKDILSKNDLYNKYILENKSAILIAKEFKCSKYTIYRYLNKYNISIRTNSEAHIGQIKPLYLIEKYKREFTGSNNPNWHGGLDKEGYPHIFNEDLKQEIRLRDNFTCQSCNMTEEEHLIVFGKNLCVHHIDYNKENSKKNNLITVCNQCNLRANFNRDYWFAYYTYIMENYIYKGVENGT